MPNQKKYRLAILSSHPIQYFSPLYKCLAQEEDIDLTVYYCSRQGVTEYKDSDLGIALRWDTPLLEGYNYVFLTDIWGNVPSQYRRRVPHPTIFKHIIRGNYDALWVYGYQEPTYLLAFFAAKLSGTSLLIRGDTHLKLARLQKPTLRNRLRKPVISLILKLFDGALAIGTENAEHYRAHGMPDNKIFCVPYTVDNELFMSTNDWSEVEIKATKRQLGIPLGMPIILFVGKLIPNKQPFVLLKAFHRMQLKTNKPAALVFVGDGRLLVSLKNYSCQNNVKNVIFAGFVNQTEIKKYYGIADIFVLPSIQEAWGLVVNEAMCAKNAIIATESIGAASDLIFPGQNGFLFPVGDVNALAAHLTVLVNNDELRQRMGQRSLEIISNWSNKEAVLGIRQALAKISKV